MIDALIKLAACPKCGTRRRNFNPARSSFHLCPAGHGRLVHLQLTARDERLLDIAERCPRATRIARNKFTIIGHDGLFRFSGSSQRTVSTDEQLVDGWVVAYLDDGKTLLVRAFLSRLEVMR